MDIRNAVREMPFYDTHCHIGCNDALGRNGGTFLCDCVRGLDVPPMDLWALLLSAYFKWTFGSIGENLDVAAMQAGHESALVWARRAPQQWWAANWQRYKRLETTGISKALVRGIWELHRTRLRFEQDMPVVQLNEQISHVYRQKGFHLWWREAFDRLNCVQGVKLVEMPYYDSPPANEMTLKLEQAAVVTALRVDSFTTLHLPLERLSMRLRPDQIGIEADSLADYLAQVDGCLERAVAGGMRALKNAYAYFGSLQLPPPDESAADRYVRAADPADYRHFEAAVLRHLLAWCNERGLPYQMHAGAVPVPWCNPVGLVDQIAAYRNVRFVLLHVYPYVGEAGSLARFSSNVYLDPCWLSVMAPESLRKALREWIGMVPPEKLVFGVDETTIEGWYGGAIIAKEVLADVLEEKIRAGLLGEQEAVDYARQMLHTTARQWYG